VIPEVKNVIEVEDQDTDWGWTSKETHVIFYVLQMSYIIIGIVESNLMNDCCITYREEL
jgi:hypothetical protein